MATLKELITISQADGVDQFIFVNKQGTIKVHDIKRPERAAKIVSTCGKHSSAIGKIGFKYLIFPRKNQKSFFIFPVGEYFFGVIKQSSLSDKSLVENVLKLTKELLKK